MALYDYANPPTPRPPPAFKVTMLGEGAGSVVVRVLGRSWDINCDKDRLPAWLYGPYCAPPVEEISCEAGAPCAYRVDSGRVVQVRSTPQKGSFVDGWTDECSSTDHPLECTVVVFDDFDLGVFFEPVPEDVDVEMLAMAEVPDDIELPEPAPPIEAVELEDLPPLPEPQNTPLPTPPEPEPEQLPVTPPPPIPAEPPPPQIPTPQPEPTPPPQQAEKKKPEPPKVQMKSVEVADDEHIVKEAPSDAQFLSDKNRNVEEETHAKDTNLEREQEGKGAYSEKSDVESEEVGAEEAEIAQLEDSEASDFDAEREDETTHSGKEEQAVGVKTGDEGKSGDEGDGGDGGDGKKTGALAMRGIEGRGAPGGPPLPKEDDEAGSGGKKGRTGKKGRRGIKTDISFEDYERIVGTDKAEEEREIAKRTRSKKKGRWGRKVARVQSSLENFTPEIKPGNQTALKTRAEPFAVYVARMHRKIHELWGFGFLEELDGKPSTHEMNKWTLVTKLELVINPDGTIDKATIAKPSGVLMFDVAALDTVFTGEPYDPTPTDIRSPDGKVYIHWRFHRDWRQCGTFGVDKFIRSDVPAGGDHGHASEPGMIGRDHPVLKKRRERARARGGDKAGDEATAGEGSDTAAAAARAAANMPAPDDPNAEKVALAWLTGFENGYVAEMVKVSGTPFSSAGTTVANDPNSIAGVYRNILKETPARKIQDWKVLSPAGYRRLFSTLPAGADAATSLFLVVRVKGERFTLTLKQQSDGTYKIVAFDR